MKKVLFVLFISLFIFIGCSGNDEMKQAIEFGKEYKEATYSINYEDLPESSDAREAYIRTKAEPFLTQEELEDDSLFRKIGIPVQASMAREVGISVKRMDFADKADNTEDQFTLEYTILLELTNNEETVEEITVDGEMIVEKRGDNWKIASDHDDIPADIMR